MALVAVASVGLAQEVQELAKGRLTTTETMLVPFASARLDATSLTYRQARDDENRQLPLEKVLRIEVERGNNWDVK